jgi:cell division cycle protein 37
VTVKVKCHIAVRMPIDYSKWKKIEVSDDEDDTHPNIDTPSLFRWRHQARVERMEERKHQQEELQQGKTSTQERIAAIDKQLAQVYMQLIGNYCLLEGRSRR